MIPSVLAVLRSLFAAPASRSPRTTRLGLDVFEDRVVPANATFNAGILVITADQASDNDIVTIVAAGANADGSTGVTATYSTPGGPVTQTFGGAGDPVTNIALDLKDGNDTVNVASLTATAVLVGEGDGNNVVNLGNTKFGGLVAGSGQNIVSIGGGSDNVWSATAIPDFTAGTGVFIGWEYAFVGGFTGISAASSVVNFNANVINMNTGAGQRSLVNINGHGDNTVNGDAGIDAVYILGDGNNTLSMGADNDRVIIDGDGNNTVSTGAGDDTVNISGDGNNAVHTNGGNDTVIFNGGGANLQSVNPLTVSVDSVQTSEGDAAGTVTFTVTLSEAASLGTVTVNFATSDGTATAGSDYTATSGTLTFAAGETTKTVTVTILNDTTVESDETFNLVLSNPSGATIDTATGVATLTNDDVAPPPTCDGDNGNHNGFDNGPHWGYGRTWTSMLSAILAPNNRRGRR
jgi:hypothetical protein